MDKCAGKNSSGVEAMAATCHNTVQFMKYDGESVEFSVSRLTHRSSRSPRSTSPQSKQLQSIPDLNERHNQLMGQLERLVRAQNSWQVDRQKMELELRQSRTQMKRLRDENTRLTQLMRDKDSLYEELREQLHQQLTIIERLERQLKIPRSSFESQVKELPDNTFSSTFCTDKLQEGWPTLKCEESGWGRLEDSLAKELGGYIELKMQYDLATRKLEQRQEELSNLKLELEELYRQRHEYRRCGCQQ